MSAKQTNFLADLGIVESLDECAEAYALVQYHKRLESKPDNHDCLATYAQSHMTREFAEELLLMSTEKYAADKQEWLSTDWANNITVSFMFQNASPLARSLFLDDLFARAEAAKLAEIAREAATLHIEHTTCTTLAILKDVDAAALGSVLVSLKFWSDLYLSGDQGANAAWLQLQMATIAALRNVGKAKRVPTKKPVARNARVSLIDRDKTITRLMSQGHSYEQALQEALLCT